MMITHRERIQTCIQGEQPDRPPVALWRHFPVEDQTPEGLAASTLNFQRTYDFDLVKVTPSSSFCLRDWGVEDEWQGNPEGTRTYTRRVIHDPRDWESLPALDPVSAPHLSAQLACLRLIRAELGPGTPMLQTVFSPLAQARNLAGADTLLAHLRLYPEAVMQGLETIAEITRRFVEASMQTGIDGVFYAIQHGQAHLLSLDEYRHFGLPFDQRVLAPTGDLWCNMLHLHGHHVHFSLVNAFEFQIVNWHDRETPPALSEAQQTFKGVRCGGLRQDTLVYRDQAEVQQEADDALAQTGGRRFILSTGCVVPIMAPHGNLNTVAQIGNLRNKENS
ncbi:MAG: uroporphyrinogen decarboxylase [Chloroflexi bacterium]|nr:uroporphyrinogen decarboxylase [Chloroflexota bacterium]